MVDIEKAGLCEVINQVWAAYKQKTPKKIQVLDAFLLYVLTTGIVQFGYMFIVGSFPFNSFLAGFLSCVGQFVITTGLRMQINPASKMDPKNTGWKSVTTVRPFIDWLFCNLILHMAVLNFLG